MDTAGRNGASFSRIIVYTYATTITHSHETTRLVSEPRTCSDRRPQCACCSVKCSFMKASTCRLHANKFQQYVGCFAAILITHFRDYQKNPRRNSLTPTYCKRDSRFRCSWAIVSLNRFIGRSKHACRGLLNIAIISFNLSSHRLGRSGSCRIQGGPKNWQTLFCAPLLQMRRPAATTDSKPVVLLISRQKILSSALLVCLTDLMALDRLSLFICSSVLCLHFYFFLL